MWILNQNQKGRQKDRAGMAATVNLALQKRTLSVFSRAKLLLASILIPQRVMDTMEPQDHQSVYISIFIPPYNWSCFCKFFPGK